MAKPTRPNFAGMTQGIEDENQRHSETKNATDWSEKDSWEAVQGQLNLTQKCPGRTPPSQNSGRVAPRPQAKSNTPKSKRTKLTAVGRRLVDTSTDIRINPPENISFQHSVLCQTCLPYRNPGEATRRWERTQGEATLLVEAGQAMDPQTRRFVPIGLPYGCKARLILNYLNTEAIRSGDPRVETAEKITAFARRILGHNPNGRIIRDFRDQVTRLAASTIRLGMCTAEGRALQVDSKIVTAFDLWVAGNSKRLMLWPSVVHLDRGYFENLLSHAVPLDERALAALAHCPMALDIYSWLAQRLHRVPIQKPHFVSWAAVYDQFGGGYKRFRAFRAEFNRALRDVLLQYPQAKLEANERGLRLRNSPPPVTRRFHLISSTR